jgi:hypothetical protein
MADQDELRLRIVPELDQQAKKQVEDELNTISGSVPVGGNGGGTGASSNAIKKDIQTRIEIRELEVRKIQQAAAEEIKFLQQRAAQGKITTTQMASDIQLVENAQVQANDRAIVSFNALQAEILKTTGLTEAQSTALQKKLLLATDRVNNNFVSMSRSMGTLTSGTQALTSRTKEANIAFANFGRIIQDAPFGILGISNNIDPLLVSFAALKASAGGTTLALRSLLGVMMGPLGLIFLVGSVLPSALVVAERAMQRKKKATKEAKEEVDEFADAIKSAANSQTSSLISSLSYTEQVEVLSKALNSVKNNILEQTLATEKQVREAEDYFRVQVEFGEMSQQQADRGLAARKAELGVTIQQDVAVRNSLETKLAESKANLLVEQSIGKVNIQRQKSVEEIKSEQQAQEDFDDYMARRGNVRNADVVDSALRRVSEQRNEAINEEERLKKAEDDRFSAFVTTSGIRNDLESRNIISRLQLYQTSEDVVGEVMSTGAMFRAQLLENEQQGLIDMMDLSVSLARTAFGDTKGVAIAEALVNTYVGVSRAFRDYTPPLSGVIAGLQLANGLAQVNKIRNTKIGDKGGSASTSSASVSAPSAPKFVNDLGAAGQVAGTIGPFGASMTPNISITANLDRQGLALAVRDGESDIATRQIPFAS